MLTSEPRLSSDLHNHNHNTMRDVPLAARDGTLSTTAGTMPRKPTTGQKLKGAVKQLQLTVTGNELKKEEGKPISAGVDPLAARAATPGAAAPSTTLLSGLPDFLPIKREKFKEMHFLFIFFTARTLLNPATNADFDKLRRTPASTSTSSSPTLVHFISKKIFLHGRYVAHFFF